MCEFFSFNVDREGNVYYINEKRYSNTSENFDSHSYISERFNLNDDEVWKYELPISIWTAKEWKRHPQNININEVIENWLYYDGGLPEDDMPLGVYKNMKNQLEKIIPHLYDLIVHDID